MRVFAGEHDPLVQPHELRARDVEPDMLPGVNHFFSRHLGNQPPVAEDLDQLVERVFAFLES